MVDSILHRRQKVKWEKLDDTEGFAHLHRRFWIQGESANILLNPQLPGDKRDGDDDIGPNCHILDIGIQALGLQKVWIRNDYIRMYKYCEEHFETNFDKAKSPAVIVTGQPGIGKSYWIYYVLCRRLAEKKPVLWFRDPVLYLFVNDGVYESPENISSTSFKTRVWTLVDVDSDEIFPPVLSQQGTNNLNIFATSPKIQRWDGMRKTTTFKVACMNPWTRREISEAAPIHALAGNDTRIQRMYDRYGPIPRFCFEFLEDDTRLNGHQARLETALSGLSSRVLSGLANGIFNFDKSDISHTILLLKRLPGPDFTRTTLGIITPTIEMAIRDQVRKETDAQRFELYQALASVPVSRGLAGVAYEWSAQERLQQQNPITVNLFPMERKVPSDLRKKTRWHSIHEGGATPLSINIERTDVDAYGEKPDSIRDKVYYVPHKSNQVAPDSFIMDNNRLFIFQFTISDDHDIEEGLLEFFSQPSLPPRANWYFIFVIPPDLLEFSCPEVDAMKEFLEEINLCSMVWDPQLGVVLNP